MIATATAAILATRLQRAQPSCMRESGKQDGQDKKTKERRRLSAALRQNLKRRKAQARARTVEFDDRVVARELLEDRA